MIPTYASNFKFCYYSDNAAYIIPFVHTVKEKKLTTWSSPMGLQSPNKHNVYIWPLTVILNTHKQMYLQNTEPTVTIYHTIPIKIHT